MISCRTCERVAKKGIVAVSGETAPCATTAGSGARCRSREWFLSRATACAAGERPASSIHFSTPPDLRGVPSRGRSMAPEFIYTMKDLRKVVPPKREILKGIWLSFFYGAKIGVLGANGAGKSSLLRIMGGADQDFIGEAFLGKGYSVGFLTQEPQLDPKKTVLQNVQEGVAEK